MKLPGVIVLYNPPNVLEVFNNIKSYIDQLEVLYVFDNSDNDVNYREIVKDFSAKIKYYSFNENKGIAFALNYISLIAYESEFKWILTMDQDSSFAPNDFDAYIKSVSSCISSDVALFSPYFAGEAFEQPQFYTSGAIMNLDAWYKIQKFDENLFIDEVDGDFTYRLQESNYHLIKIKDVKLIHELGTQYCRKILWKKLCSDNHSALRKYYIARNRIYLMKKRPSMRLLYFTDSLRKFILFILIEENRNKKFKMILKGVYHGLTNQMGKYKK